jgi:hypothetical protein
MKMEDNLNFFLKTRMMPSKKWKMTSKKIKMDDDLKKNQNGRRPQKKKKWKTTSFFCEKLICHLHKKFDGDLKKNAMKDDLQKWKTT